MGMFMATHPYPAAIYGVAGLLTFLIVSHGGSRSTAMLLFIAIWLIQASIGAMNDYVDEAGDRLGNPDKPLVQGVVSKTQILLLSFLCGSLGVALAAVLGGGAPMALLILAAGMAYNFALKGTVLSWLPYAVHIPSVAVWAFISAGLSSPVLFATYPIGAGIAVALNLADAIPDLDGDARPGQSGLARRLGVRGSKTVIVLLYVATGAMMAAVGFWAGLPSLGAASLTLAIGAGIVLAVLFTYGSSVTLGIGWHASAIAAVLFAGCWALTLERLLKLDF
jgi:4-hydroxybenzoate polyprenyltransferase